MPRTKLQIEIPRFLTVGLLALTIDLAGYFIFDNFVPGIFAKVISFVAATQVVFACNKYWTFAHATNHRHPIQQFFQFNTLYLLTLGANAGVYSVLLQFTTATALVALLCASATSTIINFIVQRRYIFNDHPSADHQSTESVEKDLQ